MTIMAVGVFLFHVFIYSHRVFDYLRKTQIKINRTRIWRVCALWHVLCGTFRINVIDFLKYTYTAVIKHSVSNARCPFSIAIIEQLQMHSHKGASFVSGWCSRPCALQTMRLRCTRVASTPRISYSIKLFWVHGDIIIMDFKTFPVFDQDSWTRQILLTNGNYFYIVNIVIMSLFMPQEIL